VDKPKGQAARRARSGTPAAAVWSRAKDDPDRDRNSKRLYPVRLYGRLGALLARAVPRQKRNKRNRRNKLGKHLLLRMMFRMLRMLLRISMKKNQANSILWRMLRTLRTFRGAGKSSVRSAARPATSRRSGTAS